MSNYTLNIQISTEDVHLLNAAGQQVAIVKEVGGASGTPVSWVAFSPFENNIVAWEEQYGLYASNTPVRDGEKILKMCDIYPATPGVYYPFENGYFGPPEGQVPGNSYGVENKSNQQFTFGFAQSVTANGMSFNANPLNAVPVPPQSKAVFTPIEKVKVFLHARFDSGVVISYIPGPALEVDFTYAPDQIIHYDHSEGRFLMGPLQ